MGNVSKITCRWFCIKKITSQFNKKFRKYCDENSDIKYMLEADFEYPKKRHNFHNRLPFLPEKMKIKKCNKLVCNLYDNYVAHIRTLKQALNHGLILKRVHKVIQFNQKAWLKSYIDMNTKLRTEARKLMNNTVFGKKTMENVRKHRNIKVTTANRNRINLFSIRA